MISKLLGYMLAFPFLYINLNDSSNNLLKKVLPNLPVANHNPKTNRCQLMAASSSRRRLILILPITSSSPSPPAPGHPYFLGRPTAGRPDVSALVFGTAGPYFFLSHSIP